MALPDESLKKTMASDRALTSPSEASNPGEESTASVGFSRSQEPSVSPERWQRIRELYEQGAHYEGADRTEFLEQACQGDSSLLAEVRMQLPFRDGAAGFLDEPLPTRLASAAAKDRDDALKPWQAGKFQVFQEVTRGRVGTVYLASSVEPGDSAWVTLVLSDIGTDIDAIETLLGQSKTERTGPSSVGRVSFERGASEKGPFLAVGCPERFLGYGFLEIGIALCAMCDWQGAISPLHEAYDILKSASDAKVGGPELVVDRATVCRYLGLAHAKLGQLTSVAVEDATSEWNEARRWFKESLKLYSHQGIASEDAPAILDQIKAEIRRCDEVLQAGNLSGTRVSKAAGLSKL